METKNTKDRAGTGDTVAVIGTLGIFLCLPLAFAAVGQFERTATPPLVALTINQAGCEYVAAAGIATDKRDSTCQITVRYRKHLMDDWGTIELPRGGRLDLSGGVVAGMAELDDGSSEPWTDEHKQAAFLLGVPWTAMILIVLAMFRFGARGARHEG